MLLAAQFPLADVRPFLADDCRCVYPVGFVRRSGRFEIRQRDPGVVEWPDEDQLWLATRALRYQGEIAGWQLGSPNATKFQGAFRRLFWSDGSAPVTRLELGLSRAATRRRFFFDGSRKLDEEETLAVARSFLELPLTIPGEGTSTALKAAQPLARLLLRSTTAWKDAGSDFGVEPWWVSPGHPLLMLIYSTAEASEPAGATRLKQAAAGIVLHHYRVIKGPEYCRVWFVTIGPGVDSDQVRLLRLHLFRLNAELECLRLVLQLLVQHEERCPEFATTGARSTRLDLYLEKALGLLSRKSVYGYPPSTFLKQVYALEREAAPTAQARFQSLLERAELCRPILETLRARDAFRSEAGYLL